MKTSAVPSNHLHSVPPRAEETTSQNNDLIDQFPLPRYFQVHFEHVHDNTDALRMEVKQLKQTTAALEAKVDILLNLLNTSKQTS